MLDLLQIPTGRTIDVNTSNVLVSPIDSSAAKTGVRVGILADPPFAGRLLIVLDIDDFLDTVKGPATFDCVSGRGCAFSEAAMNELILGIFGDSSITLDCESGECLHYTQVPGYIRPEKPDNTVMLAVSAAAAAAVFVAACLCELSYAFQGVYTAN